LQSAGATAKYPTSHCARNATFDAEGIGDVFGSGSDPYLVGLVPDGVAEARVTYLDGSSRQVAVTSNALGLKLERPVSAVTFDGGPRGAARWDLAQPGAAG